MRISRKYFAGGVSGYVFNFVISTAVANFNLVAAASADGWDGVKPLQATVTLTSTGAIYSLSPFSPAFQVGILPSNSTVDLVIDSGGLIYGASGIGGAGGVASGTSATNGSTGGTGGTAIFLQYSTRINNMGTIGGGGGGGGGGGAQTEIKDGGYPSAYGQGGDGGNGAAYATSATSGQPGSYANPIGGHIAQGGAGGDGGWYGTNGGTGGNGIQIFPGTSSANGVGGAGGLGGLAVNGNSFATWVNDGTVLGGLA